MASRDDKKSFMYKHKKPQTCNLKSEAETCTEIFK